jgi:hypothetical protein
VLGGGGNRTHHSFLPGGGWFRKNFRVVQRTGMSNLRSPKFARENRQMHR